MKKTKKASLHLSREAIRLLQAATAVTGGKPTGSGCGGNANTCIVTETQLCVPTDGCPPTGNFGILTARC